MSPNLPLFAKSLMIINTKQCYHSKDCVPAQPSEATIMRYSKKLTGLVEPLLKNWGNTKDDFRHRCLPSIVLKDLKNLLLNLFANYAAFDPY